MNTEFLLTPWPSSPLWPLFRLLKRRLPTCPEPSLVQLTILSCIVAVVAAIVQVVLRIPQVSTPWPVDPPGIENTENGEVPASSLIVQLLSRTLDNLKHLAVFILLMRCLHWTARRIFWLRLFELFIQLWLPSLSSETRSALFLGQPSSCSSQITIIGIHDLMRSNNQHDGISVR